MKLDKQINDLKSKFDHLNEKLLNSQNLDNKEIIQINKDLSKLKIFKQITCPLGQLLKLNKQIL